MPVASFPVNMHNFTQNTLLSNYSDLHCPLWKQHFSMPLVYQLMSAWVNLRKRPTNRTPRLHYNHILLFLYFAPHTDCVFPPEHIAPFRNLWVTAVVWWAINMQEVITVLCINKGSPFVNSPLWCVVNFLECFFGTPTVPTMWMLMWSRTNRVIPASSWSHNRTLVFFFLLYFDFPPWQNNIIMASTAAGNTVTDSTSLINNTPLQMVNHTAVRDIT